MATLEAPRATAVVKHSLVVAGHRTSISLEDAFWQALKAAADARGLSVAAFVAEIDAGRGDANLSSAIRVHLLQIVGRAPPSLLAGDGARKADEGEGRPATSPAPHRP